MNRTYGWTGVDSNHNVEDGTTEMRWRLADLDANQSYAFEWITERNGHYTSHDSFFFNSTSSEEHLHHFSIEVDEDITCRVYFRTFLYVITDDGSYIEVNQNSQYVTPNCDYEGDFDQFPLLVLDDDTNDSWVNTNFIENGDQTFRVDLSGLDPDRQYNLWGSVSNRYGSEYFSWGDFNPAERPSYIEVDMTIDEWTCEVGLNLYIYMYMLDGGSRYIRSGTEYTDSPCVDVGDVELEIDSDDVGYSMGLENGSNQMSWNLTDLAANQSYTFEWRVEYNDDHVMYGTETWDTGGNTSALIEWVMDIDTSITCNARVYYRTFIDTTGSDDWFQMDSGDYSEYFSCNENVYPEDYYVSFYGNINGTWQDNPDVLLFGNDAVQIQFENMSEGRTIGCTYITLERASTRSLRTYTSLTTGGQWTSRCRSRLGPAPYHTAGTSTSTTSGTRPEQAGATPTGTWVPIADHLTAHASAQATTARTLPTLTSRTVPALG